MCLYCHLVATKRRKWSLTPSLVRNGRSMRIPSLYEYILVLHCLHGNTRRVTPKPAIIDPPDVPQRSREEIQRSLQHLSAISAAAKQGLMAEDEVFPFDNSNNEASDTDLESHEPSAPSSVFGSWAGPKPPACPVAAIEAPNCDSQQPQDDSKQSDTSEQTASDADEQSVPSMAKWPWARAASVLTSDKTANSHRKWRVKPAKQYYYKIGSGASFKDQLQRLTAMNGYSYFKCCRTVSCFTFICV